MEKLQTNYNYIIDNVTEFVACYETMGQVNWLKNVIDNINEPMRLYCDNNPYSMLTIIGQVVLPSILT